MGRQICCHKSDHRPLYECQQSNYEFIETDDPDKLNYRIFLGKCGNLMHADCIEHFGKCHKSAGVKKQ